MKAIKDVYTIISLVVLMIIRPFAPGEWVGSVALAGLFVSWMDTISKICKSNSELVIEDEKERYATIMLVLSIVGLAQLILIIVNLVIGITWLNYPVVLDEITLVALLVCLLQSTIINFINAIIRKNYKR